MNYNTAPQMCGTRGNNRMGMMPAGGKTGAEGACRPGQMRQTPEKGYCTDRCPGQTGPAAEHACRIKEQMEVKPKQETRSTVVDCGCANQAEPRLEIPTGSRSQLLNYINEVSFAAYDAMLFLDTHPTDPEALAYFRKHSRMRTAALKEYERLYGPLTLDTAGDSISSSFAWSQQPWPWEGGAC